MGGGAGGGPFQLGSWLQRLMLQRFLSQLSPWHGSPMMQRPWPGTPGPVAWPKSPVFQPMPSPNRVAWSPQQGFPSARALQPLYSPLMGGPTGGALGSPYSPY